MYILHVNFANLIPALKRGRVVIRIIPVLPSCKTLGFYYLFQVGLLSEL